MRELGHRLPDKAADGSLAGTHTYLVRPRSFLIAGQLNQLKGEAGGVHEEKFQCFELYRRNLYEPEIITFDELLDRAQWHVQTASQEMRPGTTTPGEHDPWATGPDGPTADPWSAAVRPSASVDPWADNPWT